MRVQTPHHRAVAQPNCHGLNCQRSGVGRDRLAPFAALAEGLFEFGAAAVFSFLLVRHFHGRRPSRILEIRGTVSRSIENRIFRAFTLPHPRATP
jgi:hypothetical protein